jgi:hypothetical protein
MARVAPLLACALAAGCSQGAPRAAPVQEPLGVIPAGYGWSALGVQPFRFFAPSSVWNQPLRSSAPLDPRSSQLVSALVAEIQSEAQANGGPWINITSYSVPLYTVPANQPTVRVQLDHATEPALQSAWMRVPLPPTAQPAAGSDGQLVVWQAAKDRMWEFWRLVHASNGWYASWGGAMRRVSSDAGVFGSRVWPGAKPWWGASASSLALLGGLITLKDLQQHRINHALAISIPDTQAGLYALPAQRTDGKSTNQLALPEGAHLRLDPRLDLVALHLPPLILMIAQAAQRYGILVRDTSPIVTFYAQDPTPTGINPYIGPDGYFEGKYPSELLASFPWRHLMLLKMSLHRSGLGRGHRSGAETR